MTDDSSLIAETLKGRPAAFGRLVVKYQDRLFNALVHSMGNAEDARDIVQDAFVKAFVRLETFAEQSAFYSWLYRIAFNLAASHYRGRRKVDSIERLREAGAPDPSDRSEPPSGRLEQEERCRRVQQAIGRLEEEFRTVLVLREIEGCSYEVIAEILEIPVGTVRSRLYRARLQLRELLEDPRVPEPSTLS